MKKNVCEYALILVGSILYALATVVFIFPHDLIFGGTGGISVILEAYLPFSPGTILGVINYSLLVVAFFVLGKAMAVKTLVGSVLTTFFVGAFEKMLAGVEANPPVSNTALSALAGAAIVAAASGVMFYVNSSSGGTDIVALIVKKYSDMNIGLALLVTDFVIVLVGGLLGGKQIFLCSIAGLLVKTLGIDLVIAVISGKFRRKTP